MEYHFSKSFLTKELKAVTIKNRFMKKVIGVISPALYLLLPQLANAQTNTPVPVGTAAETISLCPETGDYTAFCNITSDKFGPIIGTAVIILFIIAIVIALIFLVIGGIKWITSSGDSSKVEAARNQIIAAVIGLVIVFLSFFILNFVLGLFGLSLTEIQIPVLPGF